MLTLVNDLVINRVDLVDEGANSAAFVELFKRKEQSMTFTEILSKMKAEHAAVIQSEFSNHTEQLEKAKEDLEKANATISEQTTQLEEANDALAKAKEDLEKANEELEVLKAKESEGCTCGGEADENGVCKGCGKVKKSTGFDETEVLKAMPEAVRGEFLKMKQQKEAAEEQIRKAAEEKAEAEAVAKASTMKSLPVEEAKLVQILKRCDQDIVDVLTAAATAIDEAVLSEVGKSNPKPSTNDDAWAKIEAKAEEIAKRDNVSKQKATGIVIKENPELYREYLSGGAE